jgi:hypothetical protein
VYFARLIIAGVLIGLFVMNNGIHIDENDDEVFFSSNGVITSEAYNITSVLFILSSFSIIGTVFLVIIMHTNIQILKYEINSGLHRTLSTWVSLILVDLPVSLFAAIIVASTVRWFLRLHSNSFHSYIGTIILISIAGYSLAMAVVVWTKTSEAALLYFSIYGSFSILFTGYLQAIPDLTNLYKWATTAAFSRWAFESLMLEAFEDSQGSSAYLDNYGFNGPHTSISFSILWLIVWCISLQTIVFIGLCPPIYDTNFFKERYGNKVNRLLIQEALEMDEDDVVLVDVLEGNTDRNRHAGSVVISSPLTQSMFKLNVKKAFQSRSPRNIELNGRWVASHRSLLNESTEVKSMKRESQIVLSIEKLTYLDRVSYESNSSRLSTPNLSQQPPHLHDYLDGNNDDNNAVFQGISSLILPKQSCCILDASNAGSGRVLLQLLSSYIRAKYANDEVGNISGKLYGSIKVSDFEGRPVSSCNSVYVSAGDFLNFHHNSHYNDLPSTLTVKEMLTYAALLRKQHVQPSMRCLSRFCPKAESESSSTTMSQSMHHSYHIFEDNQNNTDTMSMKQCVNEILVMMGLELVSNTIIAQSNRSKGILPSQLRCLSIGLELVTRPSLIFLEDPYKGLDWFDCQTVAVAIQNLSKSGRTILSALDRPRSSSIFGFNNMILIGSGRMIYNGLSSKASSYFEHIGFERRWDQSPLEFILDVASEKGKLKATIRLFI